MNWTILPEQPILSMTVLILISLCFMYVSRTVVHRVLRRVARLLAVVLRFQATALVALAERVSQRNRDVLLEIGMAQQERRLERDFHRVRLTAERDLAQFPDLQHTIGQHISQLEEDYHQTAETPPPAPDWIHAIDSVVRLRETQAGHPMVVKVLKDLETNLHRQHRRSLANHRKGMNRRHRLLHSMMPQWRKLSHSLERVGSGVRGLLTQADEIDKHLSRYREIQAGSERAERLLRVSSVTHFMLSSVAMMAFLAIAWLNFQLIRLPLNETMNSAETIGSIALGDLAAVTLVALEMVLGMLLLEVLQVTRIFDGFTALDEHRRRWLFWSLLGLLVVFALAHAGLLYWRADGLVRGSPLQQLIAYPVVVVEAPLLDEWLPIGARMLLGLVLPFALLFTAAPLERWMETSRVLVAEVIALTLRMAGLTLRLLASTVRNLAEVLVAVYDLIISLPLWLEGRWLQRRRLPAKLEPANQDGREMLSGRNIAKSLAPSLENKGGMTVNSR